jgi:hypothetical protein
VTFWQQDALLLTAILMPVPIVVAPLIAFLWRWRGLAGALIFATIVCGSHAALAAQIEEVGPAATGLAFAMIGWVSALLTGALGVLGSFVRSARPS